MNGHSHYPNSKKINIIRCNYDDSLNLYLRPMNYATARNNATTNTLDTHNLETQNDRNRKQLIKMTRTFSCQKSPKISAIEKKKIFSVFKTSSNQRVHLTRVTQAHWFFQSTLLLLFLTKKVFVTWFSAVFVPDPRDIYRCSH